MNVLTNARASFPLAGPVSRVLALFGSDTPPGAIIADAPGAELYKRVLAALEGGQRRLLLLSATERPTHRAMQSVAPHAVAVTCPSLQRLLAAATSESRPSGF